MRRKPNCFAICVRRKRRARSDVVGQIDALDAYLAVLQKVRGLYLPAVNTDTLVLIAQTLKATAGR